MQVRIADAPPPKVMNKIISSGFSQISPQAARVQPVGVGPQNCYPRPLLLFQRGQRELRESWHHMLAE
jgi:hypothetical protein